MSQVTDFEEKVLDQPFELPEKDKLPDLCAHAKPFYDWCEALLAGLRAEQTEISVNLALLQLQRQYWTRYAVAPPRHRNHIGTRSKHTCLFQVYRHAYELLHAMHLDVNPPQLREAAPTYAPAPPQIAGVPIGILGDAGAD